MSRDADKFSIRRIPWLVLAVAVLFGLWHAFRPEKLFVNQKVDEAPPDTVGQMTPIYTGSFHSDAQGHNDWARDSRSTVQRCPGACSVELLDLQ
jgi:hypothetical protein